MRHVSLRQLPLVTDHSALTYGNCEVTTLQLCLFRGFTSLKLMKVLVFNTLLFIRVVCYLTVSQKLLNALRASGDTYPCLSFLFRIPSSCWHVSHMRLFVYICSYPCLTVRTLHVRVGRSVDRYVVYLGYHCLDVTMLGIEYSQ